MARASSTAALLALVALGCSTPASHVEPAKLPAASASAPVPIAWKTRLDADHALVGKIWSVRDGRFVDERHVLTGLHGYVLLGEKHDNPDHHTLQARVLASMIDAGRRPIVAFEMFDVDEQGAIETSRREHPRDASALARAVSWEKSGWPPWADYAPIAQLALDASLPIVATGLPRSRMRALMKPEPDGGAAEPLDEGTPLDAEQEASLRDELRESHCGHLPDARIGAMIRFQRARDASMANALIAGKNAAHADDGVLIAGTGHTRRDRGAGRDLLARDPKRAVTSIAFAEVEAGKTDPSAYASRWNVRALPFDFVWFTPRATDEDPCAAFAH
jgi:uncharacterized iron-regulated protein